MTGASISKTLNYICNFSYRQVQIDKHEEGVTLGTYSNRPYCPFVALIYPIYPSSIHKILVQASCDQSLFFTPYSSFIMDLPSQIRSGLQNQGIPPPSLSWIRTAMPNRNPLPPLPALIATVKTRLLVADLTNPVLFDLPPPAFPPNSSNLDVKEIQLPRDILVQVLDIENLTKSKWEQVEELEAIARGEQTRGREIIRLPTGNEEDDDAVDGQATQFPVNGSDRSGLQGRGGPAAAAGNANTSTAASKSSTHRLVLQDCKGQKLYGLELKRIDKIGIGTLNIGEKFILKRGAIIARGTLLLEPTTCTILGGKVEAWQKSWVEGRLDRLRKDVGADSRN